jgi:hypothetical protein
MTRIACCRAPFAFWTVSILLLLASTAPLVVSKRAFNLRTHSHDATVTGANPVSAGRKRQLATLFETEDLLPGYGENQETATEIPQVVVEATTQEVAEEEEIPQEEPSQEVVSQEQTDEESDAATEETTQDVPESTTEEEAPEEEAPQEPSTEGNNIPSTDSPTQAPRPEDFASFNELMKNAFIALPDTEIAELLLFQPLEISLSEFSCGQISFADIRLDNDYRSSQEVGLGFSVVDLGINCQFDFDWSYIFLTGSGHAVVTTGGSSVDASLDIFSPDFAVTPPESATVTSCQTDIVILGLEFSGNIASEVFNLFETLIIDVVDSIIDETICVELNAAGADLLGDLFAMLNETVAPYLDPAEPWRYNATYPEDTMIVSPNTSLISWYDDEGYGRFLDRALDEGEAVLGSLEYDPLLQDLDLAFPNGTAYPPGYDLGINVMLRNYLLDEDRSFVLDLFSNLEEALNTSGVIVDSHDNLTDTQISILNISVYGLDTFTYFKPFERLGNFTLQNSLSWDFLSIEAHLRMEIKASSLENSIIRDAERIDPYVEDFKISVGVEKIDTVITLLMAVAPDLMSALRIGPLVDLASMIPCVVSSLYEVGLSGLNVTIGDIQLPTVEGLVSPGLDRVLKDATELGFFMYKGTILKAIPTIMETMVRDMLTDFMKNSTCPVFSYPDADSFLDIRDLLLDSEEAKVLGASGTQPYGDLASSAYSLLRGLWQEMEDDGTLGLNSLLVGPITAALSGEEGLLSIPGQLYNFTTTDETADEFGTLINRFEFGVFDLRVDGLDTIVHPMAILQPVNHPFITQSTVNMGPVKDRPLNATVSLFMALDIEDSPLAMNNVINVGFSLGALELFFEAMAMISANDFLNYRLEDALIPSCWFATLPAPDLDREGYRVEGAEDRGLELRRLFVKMSDLKLNIECDQCNPGLASLPDIVDIFDRSKVTEILSYRIPLVVEELAISYPIQVAFDRWLTDAPYVCPHRHEYNPLYQRPETWATPEFTQLSVESSDTIFFSTIVLAQVAFVLLVETHYPWELNTLEPLSAQNSFAPPPGSDMVNWTNLDGGLSQDGFDQFAEDIRAYLRENTTDNETGVEDLGINMLIRDFLVDEEGVVDFVSLVGEEPVEFSVEGVVVLIHAIRVRGLDTFTRFDALQPIAPQTILNSMHLKHLEIELVASTGSREDPPQNITFRFGFDDLNITMPLFAAFDVNVIGNWTIGNFLRGDRIFPCFLTAAYGLNFPQILVSIGGLHPFFFDGFLTDSGEAIRQSVQEVYERYSNRTLKALPILFDTSIRAFVNTFIQEYIDTKANCTHITDEEPVEMPTFAANGSIVESESLFYQHPFTSFVDFRELLLLPENSTAYGGRGNSTYGDVLRNLMGLIQNELLFVNPRTGLSAINDVVAPVTGLLSDKEGSISVPGDLMEPVLFPVDVGAFAANISVGVGDLLLENIDTIGDPLSLFEPVADRPHLLDNSVGLGIGGRPMEISLRFSIRLETVEESKPFCMLTGVENAYIADLFHASLFRYPELH